MSDNDRMCAVWVQYYILFLFFFYIWTFLQCYSRFFTKYSRIKAQDEQSDKQKSKRTVHKLSTNSSTIQIANNRFVNEAG